MTIKFPSLPALAVFRHKSYRNFWFTRLFAVIGLQMQSVAIGWQVYELARQSLSVEKSAFLLGLIVLAQFVPLFFLSLIGGQTADRFDRKKIIIIFFFVEVILSAILFCSAYFDASKALILICMAAITPLGAVRYRVHLPPRLRAALNALRLSA